MRNAKLNVSKFRRHLFFAALGLLGACAGELDPNLLPDIHLSGSVGDGPITQAQVSVTDVDGIVVAQSQSDSTANYNVDVNVTSRFPIIVQATGGFDVVTELEPDFTLESTTLDPFRATVNLNPFSTLIVKTAVQMPGGLTPSNLAKARQYIREQMNFGLDTLLVADPISTSIDETNVAAIIKASEVLGETIRRTKKELEAAGIILSGDQIIDFIAADMTDGVLDGLGQNANDRVAATFNIVSAQVLVEALGNQLQVNGKDATDSMNKAIKLSVPTSNLTTADVAINSEMITQARVMVTAAQTLDANSNANLAALAVLLAGISANTSPADIALPANLSTTFTDVISLLSAADQNQLESVNAVVRTGTVDYAPATPPTTVPPVAPGSFELSAANYSVGESDGDVYITINRVGGSDGIVTLNWRTRTFDGFGTADWANDYATFVGSERPLTFADGETTKIEKISITPDTVVEGDETFTVILESVTNGATIGASATAIVTIIDDDVASGVDAVAPVIQMLGQNPMTLSVGDTYSEPGATATDDVDGNISASIVIDNSTVNTSIAGTYSVTYNVADAAGNNAITSTRTVNVVAGNTAKPWENLVNHVIGFAKNTTGGKGGDVCWVTNLNDTGAGSLRACGNATKPTWIRFSVSGTINLVKPLYIKSNITVDGNGQDITLTGYGIVLGSVSNVIIHNLKIVNPAVDGIEITDATTNNIWIDHCTLVQAGDENLSVVRAATDVTVSWTKFQGNSYAVLISSSPTSTQDKVIRVTMHHNHFEKNGERHPLMRFGKVHMFNNFIDSWRLYAASAVTQSYFLSENNIWKYSGTAPGKWAINSSPSPYDPEPATSVKSVGDWLINNPTVDTRSPELMFNPTDWYSYTPEPADSALMDELVTKTGWQINPSFIY